MFLETYLWFEFIHSRDHVSAVFQALTQALGLQQIIKGCADRARLAGTPRSTPAKVSEWIKVWSVKVYDFHRERGKPMLDNEAAKWEMALGELAVERSRIHTRE